MVSPPLPPSFPDPAQVQGFEGAGQRSIWDEPSPSYQARSLVQQQQQQSGFVFSGLGRQRAFCRKQAGYSSKESVLPPRKFLAKSSIRRFCGSGDWCCESVEPEAPKVRWTKIFQLQHSEGYWELTTELGELINVNVDLFANMFLKSKGIHSLGVKAHADILRLLATLLVLQLMRLEKLEEGKLLRNLFSLVDSSQPRPERWEQVKRAVDWVCWADRQYPCIYSRLEFGFSWESSTRQLLGYESLSAFSPLSGLNLQWTPVPLLAH